MLLKNEHQLFVDIKDSTNMACFFVCGLGILKYMTGKEFPFYIFFKDWSFEKSPYYVFSEFEIMQQLVKKTEGIFFKKYEVESKEKLILTELNLLQQRKPIISSVDSYYIPHHPYHMKRHQGHFVVVTELQKDVVHVVDVELRRTVQFPFDQWLKIRTKVLGKNIYNFFTVEIVNDYQHCSYQNELKQVYQTNYQTYFSDRGKNKGRRGFEVFMQEIAESDRMVSLLANHYGMRTVRYQHAQYLRNMAQKWGLTDLKEFSKQVFDLAKQWGSVHLLCSKYVLHSSAQTYQSIIRILRQIYETEYKLLHDLDLIIKRMD